MDLRVLRPTPKSLPKKPKDNPTTTPQRNQTHIRHDGWDVPALFDPGRNELAEAVAPDVLIDCDGDEDGACDWFVGVDCVGGGDGGEGCDLDTGAGVAYYDYDLGHVC